MSAAPFVYGYAAIDRLRGQLPPADRWLGAGERRALAQFRDPSRRETWLAGRWLAKRLIAGQLAATSGGWKCSDIEIFSAGARPRAWFQGRPLPWSLSIAHTRRGAVAALSCRAGILPGVDLVELRDYGPGFAALWFTADERRRLAPRGGRRCAVLWAIKEALYKAVNAGEPFDPRAIESVPGGSRGDVCWFRVRGELRRCRLALWRTPQEEIAVSVVHCLGDDDD